jgi:hypothetical protein
MFVIKFFAGSHTLARTCAEGSARNSKARKLHQIRRDGESIFIFFVLSNVIIIYFYCGPFYIIYLFIFLFIHWFICLYVWHYQSTNVFTAFDMHYESEEQADGKRFLTAAQRHTMMKEAAGWLLQVTYTCYPFC